MFFPFPIPPGGNERGANAERTIGEHGEKKRILRPRVGYRCWMVRRGETLRLRSSFVQYFWTPGELEAACLATSGGPRDDACEKPPTPKCECGIYGYFELEDLPNHYSVSKNENHLIGGIMGWGRTQVHKTGFRAQRAKVLCISWDEHNAGMLSWEEAQALGRTHGAVVVKGKPALLAYMEEFRAW